MTTRVLHFRQLPPGFLQSLGGVPGTPVHPRPSATLVLMRAGREPLEVLLLRRSPISRFIPGAWVFPGGTVDREDADRQILSRIRHLSPEWARSRLGFPDSGPPAHAYWVAALRETFEETGILLRSGEDRHEDEPSARATTFADESSAHAEILASEPSARAKLLAGEMSFRQVLESLELALDAGALLYTGHWLTPECEPLRFETRFFSAEVPAEAPVEPHEKELVEAVWLTPRNALARNQEGALPLVPPTLFTLEELAGFRSVEEALGQLERKAVPRILPVPELIAGGIRFHLPV